VPEWVVVGAGNPDGGDDRVGHVVVAELVDLAPDGVDLLQLMRADPAALMDAWAEAERAIVIDAMESGAPAGTVQRFDVSDEPLPADVRVTSTHALGVDTAVEMARALGRLPGRISVYGIEGGEYVVGGKLSGEVADAVPVAVEMILGEIVSADG
jgi:hydrogenase maturation protease